VFRSAIHLVAIQSATTCCNRSRRGQAGH
jgi:hypothetical protein